MNGTSVRRRLLAAGVAIALLAVPLAGGAAEAKGKAQPPGKPVTVMTRNLYLGADLNPPVLAALAAQAAGKSAPEIVTALANATHVARAIVDQTNFPVRAGLLADEIAANEPDLIGVQEVAWWRQGPLQLDQVGVPNATATDYDFLEILLDKLAERGVQYEPVSIATRADVEAPSFTGSLLAPPISTDARDVRLTMRDVVLMHVEDGLSLIDEFQKVFNTNFQVPPVLGRSINFDRGYQWVDVRAGATRFRFVNTHLESSSSDIALAQAAELVNNAKAQGRTTIFVCDCNSDPLNGDIHDVVPPIVTRHWAAYRLITGNGAGEGGFTDEWLEWAPAEEGFTSGLSELVNDATAAGFRHRIDMVFARTADGDGLAVDRGRTTGTTVASKDPTTGLWPSDHGGVVLRLRGI